MLTLENPKAYRLPHTINPSRYDIELDARVGRDTFKGRVTVKIDIAEKTDTIELHAHELLTLTSATVETGSKTLRGEISQNAEAEMASITFPSALPTGPATLTILYDGNISPTLEGLYLAKDGPDECLSTQCEETDARKIFPCWDEPTFKAHFAWKITTDPQNTVLANGPLLSVKDTPETPWLAPSDQDPIRNPKSEIQDSRTWSFAPTKLMSSYLCALVVGEIDGTKEEEVNGTPIRVWAMKGKGEMGRFAHDYTKKLLPWYEHYFEAPYHFDKYDQAAVPGFAAGAMENSGLVIYVQSALIMNPKTASWNQEKTIAHVVAHETAHMWFGNLVTMKWWDDLWLNEAFAEWISNKAVHSLTPDYNVWNDFQFGKNAALADDALEFTHPIYNPVETPAQATELFDNIAYQKGCAVLRMLENFIGEDAFRAGLRTYIKDFAESNATKEDLWHHLAQSSGESVEAVMSSWINQGGYPVISISLDGTILKLSQRRFFSSPDARSHDQMWQVPIVLRYEDTAGVHNRRILLDSVEKAVSLAIEGELKWLYTNTEEIGFYRQHLDSTIMPGLLANLDKLSPLEQTGLLSDQWALTRNGTQGISEFLDVLSALLTSTHYNVLEAAVGRLHGIEDLLLDLGDQSALRKFRSWVADRLQPQMEEVGYQPRKSDSQNDTQRRVALADAMSTLAETPEAIRQATHYADMEANDPTSVDPNLAGLYVAAAAITGDRARFDRYVDIYTTRKDASASPQETNRYLYSLADFRKPDIMSRIFTLMDDGTIPQEAIGRVLRQMLALNHAQVPAWNYIKANWPTIRNLGDMWTGFLVEMTGRLPSTLRSDVVSFFDANLQGVADKPYARALETMDQLAEFKQRIGTDLVAWFKR